MTDTLSKLFGSNSRVKLLRLFLFNPQATFTAKEVSERSRVVPREVARELACFVDIELITKRMDGRIAHYALNQEFVYLSALQNLLLNASARAGDIYERIKRVGVVKLVVVSGIFVGEWEGRVDLLIVADKVHEQKLDKHIQVLESEIGRQLRYTLLSTQEFFYRLNMNDHLLRDVLDYTHRIMFDRLDIGLK